MEEAHLQCRQGCVVQICHTISSAEDVQYGSVTSSVWMDVYSAGLPKLLSWLLVPYFTGRMMFYRQSNSALDSILYSDLDEIPLACSFDYKLIP